MTENEISYQIRGAIFDVYNELGPGLLESIYEAALVSELKMRGLRVESQIPLPIYYKGVKLPVDYRLDLLVEGKVIVELKSVHEMQDVFHLQLNTYLKISGLHLGILVNFNCDRITENIWRKVNKL